ncbi:unnamed protein product, partial [Meganyctiphanes norvegica]
MLGTASVLLLTAWTAIGIQGDSHGRPRDCEDLIQQDNIYEGHYIVYPDNSVPSKASIIYCSRDDGMEALPSEIAEREIVRNCLDLQEDGKNSSGLGIIYPYLDNPVTPVLVLCDQDTDGGGWTVIQSRYDGTEDFYKSWTEYVNGFGDPNGEVYIGNAIISALTEQTTNELRVDLTDWKDKTAYAQYQDFRVDAQNDYMMSAGLYHGTAGDSLFSEYSETREANFSTFDADHDLYPDVNCAEELRHGGWWYMDCGDSNLNGLYYPIAGIGPPWDGIYWYTWGWYDSLQSSKMMIRPLF